MAQSSATVQETDQEEKILLRQEELRRRQERDNAEAERADQPSAGVSIFDPRFIFAFILGITLDVLSYIFMGLDAGIIAAAVNAILGLFVVWLMVSLGKDKDQANEMRRQAIDNARLGRKGLAQRRQMTSKLLGKRASRKILKRSLIMYIGNSIPIVNFIPFWTIGIIMMLREK